MSYLKKDIKNYCAKNRISISEFAKLAGISPFTLLTYMRKGKRLLLPSHLRAAKILEYSYEEAIALYLGDKSLAGSQIGHWTVIEPMPFTTPGESIKGLRYRCQCVCGKIKDVSYAELQKRTTKSCGCHRLINLSAAQAREREKYIKKGHQLFDVLHKAKLAANYTEKKANKNSTSGVRGVSPARGKWRATITAAGKQYELGLFDNFCDAVAARKQAEEKYHKPLQDKVEQLKRH